MRKRWHNVCLVTCELMDFLPEAAMDMFAPEFSKFWLPEASGSRADSRADDDKGAQQAALEELAERVNAARSVV